MDKMYFAENIKYLRERDHITQEELGKRVGKTNTTVAKWESGVATPAVAIATELAKIFRVNMADLLYTDIEHNTHDDESEMICLYRQLNAEGKENVLSYMRYIAEQGLYKKSDKAV